MVIEGEQVVVGDVNRPAEEIGYEVLCRRHHRKRMTSAAAHAGALSPDVLPVHHGRVGRSARSQTLQGQGLDEVRISINKEGELVGEPIRLKSTGWASDKSVRTAVEAVENDPKLRADLQAKAKSAQQHMEDHNWGNTQNRKEEMQALIDKPENWP